MSFQFPRAFRNLIKRLGTVPCLIALLFRGRASTGRRDRAESLCQYAGRNQFPARGLCLFGRRFVNPMVRSPIKDAQLQMNTGVLAYARTLDVWGKSGKFDVILPYSQLSGSAMVAGQPRERDVSGFNDPRFRFSVNFYGAPALSLQEFANYKQDVIIGASVQVSAPLGQYDRDKLVNLGNNRWFVKPDIGISKAWGPLTIELSTGVMFFSNNDDYFGGKTLRAGSHLFHAATRHVRPWPWNLGCLERDLGLRRAHDHRRRAER